MTTTAKSKREARAALYGKEVTDWTLDELVLILTERYAPTVIPPCRVCGGELSIASSGGGPTVWACNTMEDDPEKPDRLRRKKDRACADDHYSQSRYEDRRCGGDDVVMEALRRLTPPDNMVLCTCGHRLLSHLHCDALTAPNGDPCECSGFKPAK